VAEAARRAFPAGFRALKEPPKTAGGIEEAGRSEEGKRRSEEEQEKKTKAK